MAKGNSKSGQTHSQPQSAITGRFVKESYAKSHPKTTFTEKPKQTKKGS